MFGNKGLSTTKRNERSLTPWFSSMNPLTSIRDEIMDVFDNFNFGMAPTFKNEFIPNIEIKDKGNSYIVSAEVPGMSDKDMNVTIRDNNLILEGEKKEEKKEEKKGIFRSELSYGSFYRTIPLTDEVDPDKVTATYQNGVLKVMVEKRPEAQRKSKRIPISSVETSSEKLESKH
jgi:HSP20 family protein